MTDKEAFEKLLKGEEVSVSYDEVVHHDGKRCGVAALDSTVHLNKDGKLETETGKLLSDTHVLYFSEAHKAKLNDAEKEWLLTVISIFDKVDYVFKDEDDEGDGYISILGKLKTGKRFRLTVDFGDITVGNGEIFKDYHAPIFQGLKDRYTYTLEALGL